MKESTQLKFAVRNPDLDDLQAIADLIIASDIAESGASDFSAEELRLGWERTGFNLQQDAWVAVAPGNDNAQTGQVVGYEEIWNRSEHAFLEVDGYIHPAYKGLGIGTALLRLAEERGRQHIPLAPPGRRVFMGLGIYANEQTAVALLENEGFHPLRHFWRMEIELTAAPPLPEWPSGLQVRNFIPGQDERSVYEAVDEAFQDHWGHVPTDYGSWLARLAGRENFDPGLCFLALQDGQIVGCALCSYRAETGWVNQLAVRRPWRRMGLGLALLNQAFGEFYKRGTTTVGLGVDARSLTGATRLYERAGMHMVNEIVAYEKELRPGFDPRFEA